MPYYYHPGGTTQVTARFSADGEPTGKIPVAKVVEQPKFSRRPIIVPAEDASGPLPTISADWKRSNSGGPSLAERVAQEHGCFLSNLVNFFMPKPCPHHSSFS